MQTYTMSELIHSTGKVVSAADRETVKLTSRGRDKYVILRIEEFERMQLALTAADPRKVFLASEMSDDMIDALFDGVPEVDLSDLPIVHGTERYEPDMSEADGLRLVSKPEST